MSKYTYINIGRVGISGSDWSEEIESITGEIIDTVERDGSTRGVIVEENSINER